MIRQQITADWMRRAACAGQPQEPFFPPAGHSGEQAKQQYCRRCPVTTVCLNYALTWRISDGVWGNTSPDQRRNMGKPPIPKGFEPGGGMSSHPGIVIEATRRRVHSSVECKCNARYVCSGCAAAERKTA